VCLKNTVKNCRPWKRRHGLALGEGPVWFGRRAISVVQRLPTKRYPQMGRGNRLVAYFANPSNFVQCNIRDRKGGLVTCENWRPRVIRTEYEARSRFVMDSLQRHAPELANDVVVKSDAARSRSPVRLVACSAIEDTRPSRRSTQMLYPDRCATGKCDHRRRRVLGTTRKGLLF